MPIGDRPPEPLSPAEVRALLAACSVESLTGMRNRALLVVLWRAGLRCAEALALRPCDIDSGAGTIRVRFGKGRKARTVGVDDDALAVVRAWLGAREAAGVRRAGCCSAMWRGCAGRPMSPRYVRAEVAVSPAGPVSGTGFTLTAYGILTRWSSAGKAGISRSYPASWAMPRLPRRLSTSTHLFPAEVIGRARSRSWTASGGKTSCRAYRW